ncbi:MAG: arginase family hydrolase, arginase/agmainase/formiminoglutamate hydrolase [Mycobacterium sp.]|jgi:arginase|nr:arginase family hydrolase, arginase/agmainase/formiminoglutamate hydrolase [Mycobacterium sp.]
MTDLELIGVPFDGYGRPGNQARAAAALRDAGLLEVFAGHRVAAADDLTGLAESNPVRGPQTGLMNEAALLTMTAALASRVGHALRSGRFPVVYGGDCSILFGIATGLRDRPTGLVFVDGHEDTMPLDVSEDGEAANTEIGLLLGLTGRLLTGPLARIRGTLLADQLAVLGPRDGDWRRRFNVGSLRDLGVWLAPLPEVQADPAAAGAAAVAHVRVAAPRWWLHIDLDVLDPLVFGAQGIVGFPDEPGGLTWAELTALGIGALGLGGCCGLSVAIYDPDQDPGGAEARRVVGLIGDLVLTL